MYMYMYFVLKNLCKNINPYNFFLQNVYLDKLIYIAYIFDICLFEGFFFWINLSVIPSKHKLVKDLKFCLNGTVLVYACPITCSFILHYHWYKYAEFYL